MFPPLRMNSNIVCSGCDSETFILLENCNVGRNSRSSLRGTSSEHRRFFVLVITDRMISVYYILAQVCSITHDLKHHCWLSLLSCTREHQKIFVVRRNQIHIYPSVDLVSTHIQHSGSQFKWDKRNPGMFFLPSSVVFGWQRLIFQI